MSGQEIRELLLKAALLNALKHDGKAKAGPVIGILLAERPDLKAWVRELLPLAREVVEEVNRMSFSACS